MIGRTLAGDRIECLAMTDVGFLDEPVALRRRASPSQ
jgi:hypothetical protein